MFCPLNLLKLVWTELPNPSLNLTAKTRRFVLLFIVGRPG
jgi:hypothetical protein